VELGKGVGRGVARAYEDNGGGLCVGFRAEVSTWVWSEPVKHDRGAVIVPSTRNRAGEAKLKGDLR
jgi:hypothetical protein